MDGRGSSCMYAQLRCVRVLREAQSVLLFSCEGETLLYVIRSDLSPIEKVRIINKELVKEPTPAYRGQVDIQGEGSCSNHSTLLYPSSIYALHPFNLRRKKSGFVFLCFQPHKASTSHCVQYSQASSSTIR
jgi:hypothetical protein